MVEASLQGKVLVLYLFDVCEEINLDRLRDILGPKCVGEGLKKHAAYENVQFAHPPVVEAVEPFAIRESEAIQGTIKYYDYGVVSLIFELPFQGDWGALVNVSSHWMSESRLERAAMAVAREKLKTAAAALIKPYKDWLSEDYFILFAAKPPHYRRASRAKSYNRASRIIRATWPSSAGMPPSFMTPSLAPRPRSNYWSTPTRNCWNSVTMMNCSHGSWRVFTNLWTARVAFLSAGAWPVLPRACSRFCLM